MPRIVNITKLSVPSRFTGMHLECYDRIMKRNKKEILSQKLELIVSSLTRNRFREPQKATGIHVSDQLISMAS